MAEHLPLDKEETSGRFSPDCSYQSYRASLDLPAWYASGGFYHAVDSILGTEYLKKWSACRTSAWFARHRQTGKVRVLSSSCRLRWCSLCATARRNYISHQVADWLKSAAWPKFLTLTVKHTDEPLSDQVDELYAFFRKFRKTKLLKGSVFGGVWFFQVKRSKSSGQWHPHIHCAISGKYMGRGLLSKLWLKITSHSKIVDIRPIREPETAAAEVARYASTPADLTKLPSSDYVELFEAFHHRKVCGSWGTAKQVSLRQDHVAKDSDWESLGSWSFILSAQGKSDDADAILKAFATDDILEEGISLYDVQRNGMSAALDKIVERSPPKFLPGFYK